MAKATRLLFVLLLPLMWSLNSWALPADIQAAKEQGARLYSIGHSTAALEIHRHKDPTTAAADQRKGRNPRYWRDMSEAEVEKIQEERYQKNIRLR